MNRDVKVGLVSVIGILILIVGVLFAKGVIYFGESNKLFFLFENAKGLQIGEAVSFNGVKIGKVADIKLSRTSVCIEADIWDMQLIDKSMRASIDMKELTGGKQINVLHNSEGGSTPVQSGDTIFGVSRPDISELLNIVADSKDKFIRIIDNLDKTVAGVNQLLEKDSIDKTIITAAENLRDISLDIKNITESGKINNILHKTESTIDDLSLLINENKGNIKGIVDKTNKLIDEVNNITDFYKNNKEKFDLIVNDISTITGNLSDSTSIAGKLINEKSTAQKLDSLLINMKQLMEQIKEHGINTNIRLGTRP
jgi:phospholipid/cholesterol/gamma-HCH transport system substrate-binding protein